MAREAGAGTRDLFNEVVMGGIDHDTPGADWYRSGNGEVWAMIASSEGAIGYLSLNYFEGWRGQGDRLRWGRSVGRDGERRVLPPRDDPQHLHPGRGRPE